MRWPERVVKRDCCVDDALAGFILALRAAAEHVLSRDFGDLHWDLIIDKAAD